MNTIIENNWSPLIEFKRRILKISFFIRYVVLISIGFFIIDGSLNSTFIVFLFLYNPFINSFIHADFNHLFSNITLLILVLFPKENINITFIQLITYTTIISLICLPFILLNITEQMIGISGLFYLLLAKYFFSIKVKYIFKLILLFVFLGELNALENNDKISHLNHIIGLLLGVLLYFRNNPLQNPIKKITI